MFFPDRIKSIRDSDKVLEVGPGSCPHPRSDVFLELRYDSEGDRLLQSGNAQPNFDYSRTVFYDGGQFPFDTNEFDYVICSHVLEHLAIEDVECFINELQRIAPKGYLEFPSLYYELICFPEAHELFMNYKHGNILIFPKNHFPKTWSHQIMRCMWYRKGGQSNEIFRQLKDFFFIGFEWKARKPIQFEIVVNFDDLADKADYQYWQNCFASFSREPKALKKRMGLVGKIMWKWRKMSKGICE